MGECVEYDIRKLQSQREDAVKRNVGKNVILGNRLTCACTDIRTLKRVGCLPDYFGLFCLFCS